MSGGSGHAKLSRHPAAVVDASGVCPNALGGSARGAESPTSLLAAPYVGAAVVVMEVAASALESRLAMKPARAARSWRKGVLPPGGSNAPVKGRPGKAVLGIVQQVPHYPGCSPPLAIPGGAVGESIVRDLRAVHLPQERGKLASRPRAAASTPAGGGGPAVDVFERYDFECDKELQVDTDGAKKRKREWEVAFKAEGDAGHLRQDSESEAFDTWHRDGGVTVSLGSASEWKVTHAWRNLYRPLGAGAGWTGLLRRRAAQACLPAAALLAQRGARRGDLRRSRLLARPPRPARRRCGEEGSGIVVRKSAGEATSSQPTEAELERIFQDNDAAGGATEVTFDQALRIEAIDAILEDGGTSLKDSVLARDGSNIQSCLGSKGPARLRQRAAHAAFPAAGEGGVASFMAAASPRPTARAATEREPWLCKSCKTSKGTRFRNSGWSLACAGCKLHKGISFGEVAPSGGGSPAAPRNRSPKLSQSEPTGDFAPWQYETMEKKIRQQLEAKHRKELEQARREGAARAGVGDTAAAPSPPEPQGDTAEDLARIKRLTALVQAGEHMGDTEKDNVLRWKTELDALRAKRQETLPIGKRYAACNRDIKRLEGLAATVAKDIATTKADIERLEVKLALQQEQQAKHDKDLTAARALLGDLGKQRLQGGKEPEVIPVLENVVAKLEDHLYDEGLDGADALEISQEFQEAKDRLLQKISEAKAARDRAPPAPLEAPQPAVAQVPTTTVWDTAATSRAFLQSLGQQVPEGDEEARNAPKLTRRPLLQPSAPGWTTPTSSSRPRRPSELRASTPKPRGVRPWGGRRLPASLWTLCRLLLLLACLDMGAESRSVPSSSSDISILYGNITEWGPQAQGFLQSDRAKRFDGVGFVELRRSESHAMAIIAAFRKDGWKATYSPGVSTGKGGVTGGEVMAVRAHLQATTFDHWRDPKGDALRGFAPMVLHTAAGNIVVAVLYLHPALGFGKRNKATLVALGAFLAVQRAPWIVVGDWNHDPQQLTQSQWIGKLGGELVLPDVAATCDKGQGRLLDFGVAKEGYAHLFKLEAYLQVPWATHCGLQLTLRGARQRWWYQALDAPRSPPAAQRPKAEARPDSKRTRQRQAALAKRAAMLPSELGWISSTPTWPSVGPAARIRRARATSPAPAALAEGRDRWRGAELDDIPWGLQLHGQATLFFSSFPGWLQLHGQASQFFSPLTGALGAARGARLIPPRAPLATLLLLGAPPGAARASGVAARAPGAASDSSRREVTPGVTTDRLGDTWCHPIVGAAGAAAGTSRAASSVADGPREGGGRVLRAAPGGAPSSCAAGGLQRGGGRGDAAPSAPFKVPSATWRSAAAYRSRAGQVNPALLQHPFLDPRVAEAERLAELYGAWVAQVEAAILAHEGIDAANWQTAANPGRAHLRHPEADAWATHHANLTALLALEASGKDPRQLQWRLDLHRSTLGDIGKLSATKRTDQLKAYTDKAQAVLGRPRHENNTLRHLAQDLAGDAARRALQEGR
ncbi:unnamed protein product [Prorocentrum cordatum]|uniref:Endonuclease/exonuclease/phosphatase domain-containing protein n=1 Tax=Prorocentrum cordatum TaxID=2364126 RepID=A0ABN9PU17_9DINO|nr:unnamed protein product [Polarella glacialis]